MVARQLSRISGEATFLYVFLKQIVRMSITESFDDESCLEATMHLNVAGALVVLGKDKPLLRHESRKAGFMQIAWFGAGELGSVMMQV